MPTLPQISSLLESTPLDPPVGNKPLYVRLKNGYRNVILAVVDQGVVSYLKIADAAFGKEKIYEAQAPRGNKLRGPPRNKFKKR
jgi:tRNA-splicing endonuclease subunit Sen54